MAMPDPHYHDASSMSDVEKGDLFIGEEETAALPRGLTRQLSKQISIDSKDRGTENPPSISLTDWNGPDDPNNPHNWPMWLKFYHATVPGLFGFAVTFGTSVYTPAVSDIMHNFHTSRTVAIVGVTVYTLGLGFGPIISAPLSERYGRRLVYMLSSPIFMLFVLGTGFSKSLASLIICRFLAGLTGSPALAIGAGTNADLFLPKDRAVVTSIFLMAPFLGPSLGYVSILVPRSKKLTRTVQL